jgi:uncharacterized protein (DUF1697 family)
VRYAAFLRAINVGGKNVVRMEELRARAESLGLAGVSTYLQSGNLLFDSDEDAAALTKRLEALLREMTGNEISALLRSPRDLEAVLALDPFAGLDTKESHRYVTPAFSRGR